MGVLSVLLSRWLLHRAAREATARCRVYLSLLGLYGPGRVVFAGSGGGLLTRCPLVVLSGCAVDTLAVVR